MSAYFRHVIHSEGGPIDYTSDEHTTPLIIRAMTISWASAPTTAGDFTIALDSHLGDDYDTELYVVDPAADSLTAVLLSDVNLPMFPGDAIRVVYANADSRRMGIQVILEG